MLWFVRKIYDEISPFVILLCYSSSNKQQNKLFLSLLDLSNVTACVCISHLQIYIYLTKNKFYFKQDLDCLKQHLCNRNLELDSDF